MEKLYNQHVPHLPEHLLEYVVDQNYSHYSPIDQAVWRYVMRQNVNYLPSVCHGSYLDGLKTAGLSIESIPSMYGMTRILKNIGWFAVAVDGFIPPTVFMEFQAYNTLVIAADIRQINHIGYTPAPDILHEAAGHAPIIADKEYAYYLKKFGEIGSKAFSSSQDIELFDSIRELSILKEAPNVDQKIIKEAEDKVLKVQSKISKLSEMSKIRNLHWWTVEYGLIGNLENPKIYGAGLLSSISESVNCLSNKVKKIPYDIHAANTSFDITREQPQLFVAKNFKHLNQVLDNFSKTMAVNKGGDYGISLAIDSASISTCEFDSGLQISGVFSELIKVNGKGAYLKTTGPTALAYKNKEIVGHGTKYHIDGFGAPIGTIKDIIDTSIFKNQIGKNIEISYESGIILKGILLNSIENELGQIMLLSFKDCSVILEGDDSVVLFDPSWGNFDLALGINIISAFPNAADRKSFPIEKIHLTSHTIQLNISDKEKRLHDLYQRVRDMRVNKVIIIKDVKDIMRDLIDNFHQDWLLLVEICELIQNKDKDLYNACYNHLLKMKKEYPKYEKLIMDGLKIIK